MTTPKTPIPDGVDFLDHDPRHAMDHDDDILSALDRPAAQGWKPVPGDTLSGRIVDIYTSGPGEYGEYPILEVANSNGEVIAVHCFHTTMKSAVERRQPKVGDRIGVRYEGRKTSGGFGDKGYESYRVVVMPAAIS